MMDDNVNYIEFALVSFIILVSGMEYKACVKCLWDAEIKGTGWNALFCRDVTEGSGTPPPEGEGKGVTNYLKN